MSSKRLNATDNVSISIGHGQLEIAKWVAIITMTIDHYGKIVDPSIYLETNAIGRVTFPLIAWIIGTRLAINPELGRRYLVYLIPWALASQPVYMYVGKNWSDPNIFCTLSLGVAAHCAWQMSSGEARYRGIVLFITLLVPALFVDYGVFGVLTVPLIAHLAKISLVWSAYSIGLLGILSNVSIRMLSFGPGGMWALLSSVVALTCLRSEIKIPRIPKQIFYAYYPAHLLALYVFSRLLETGS